MDAQQQRHLLVALETEPDGWRRCALAFVEAQALRGEFSRMVAEGQSNQELAPPDSSLAPARYSARSQSVRPMRWLAIAAALLLAFTLGFGTQGWWSARIQPDQTTVVATSHP